MKKLFGFARVFEVEVFLQVWNAEVLGSPIEKGHSWNTTRGNSLCVIQDVLIPGELVRWNDNDEVVLTKSGRELIGVILSDRKLVPTTEISKLQEKIEVLRVKEKNYPRGRRRRLKAVDICRLKNEIQDITNKTQQFKKGRVDSYGMTKDVL